MTIHLGDRQTDGKGATLVLAGGGGDNGGDKYISSSSKSAVMELQCRALHQPKPHTMNIQKAKKN